MTLQEAYTKFASSMAAVEAAMSQAAAAARAMAEIDTPDIASSWRKPMTTIENLEDFLTRLRAGAPVDHVRPSSWHIPGYDAYSPSYLSGGTSGGVTQIGKLESNSQRDQSFI